ncbi:Ig-like domain-containing protein [Clostridium brassicae]|uniref:SbsA Ig-like domain-containing protein n=1 Tax=Clostridium brassicae TaxID=2999072 RepID=A0ABT4D4D1_9CLOT|nr:hypothetical protein [Clostridium brassicae]MCY6957132.1 hypothetical protein [Clostridium brassicae]
MSKRKIELLITFLLLNTTISNVEIVNAYDLKTKDGQTHSYKTEELQKSLTKTKDERQRTKLYKQFAENVSQSEYLGVKDKDGKYITYDNVVKEYSEGKRRLGAKTVAKDMSSILTKYSNNYKTFGTKEDLPQNKVWKITFNHEVDRTTMNTNNLKVVDSEGKVQEIKMEPHSGNLKVWDIKPASEWKAGETYALIMNTNITTNLTSHKGLKKDVVFVFSIKADAGTTNPGKEFSKSEMLSILKDISGGYYDDSVEYDYMGMWNLGKETKYGCVNNSIDVYKERMERGTRLENKYFNNPIYSNLTDPYLYEKLPNTTVSFKGLSRRNLGDSKNIQLYTSNKKDRSDLPKEIPNLYLKPYDTTDGYAFTIMEGKSETLSKYIWRPDLEKEMVEEINKLRISKGAKPLTVKNDLVAMAKFSAKRSHLGYSHNSLISNTLEFSVRGGQLNWCRGCVPFPYDYGDLDTDRLMNDEDTKGHDAIYPIEDNTNKLFNYPNKVRAFSDVSNYIISAKGFLKEWKDETNYQPHGRGEQFIKYSKKANIERDFLDPNLKYIGVGSIYEGSRHKADINGMTGVFVITE